MDNSVAPIAEKKRRKPSVARAVFAVDRRTFGRVAELGLSHMVVFLMLAQGTGGDNRTTSWGVDSVERYTGLGRRRARAGMIDLLNGGILTNLTPERKQGRCRYRIEPWASQDGLEVDPDWIWLPNSICLGVGNEAPPIERLRQSQSAAALRLFVMLYGVHRLNDEGGIVWRDGIGLSQQFESSEVFSNGAQRICRFVERGLVVWQAFGPLVGYDASAKGWAEKTGFWSDLKLLQQLGLLSFVPYLVEGPDGEIIHAADCAEGDEPEFRAALSAASFAHGLLPESLASSLGGSILLPVASHLKQASVVGIGRLRYRPQTSATAQWLQKIEQLASSWTEHYGRQR